MLQSISTEIVSENLDKQALDQQFGLDAKGVEAKAAKCLAQENAVVNTTAKFEEVETRKHRQLTVTENGDWLIFF